MARRFTLVLAMGFLGAQPASAQDFPAWYARGAVGGTEMHGVTNNLFEADLDQLWLEGRVGRAFGERGLFAVDAGVAHSAGGIGFTTYTSGLELRAFARSLVSPYARLEAGYLTEDIENCFVAGWGLGLSVRATRGLALRGETMFNAHCDDGHGPVVASAGLEFRW